MDNFLNLLGENSQEDKSAEEFIRQMAFSAMQDSEGFNSFGINQAAFGHAGLSFDMTEGELVNSGELYDLSQEIRSLGINLINAKLLPEAQIKIKIERLNPSLPIFAGNDEWVTLSKEDSLHYLLCQLCSKSFNSTSEQEAQKQIINDILAKGVNINYTGNKALNEDLKETYSEYGPSFEDIREVVTPLSKAAKNHDIDLILYLLEQGAEVTPAMLRTISRSPHLKQAGEVVMYLVSEGVDINKADDKGTILHGMRGTGVEADKFVLLMLESGVDPCKQDAKGYSALHVAVENMRYKASWMMIEYGANPYTEAHDGKSAIDLAQNQTQRRGLEFNYQRQQENPDFKKICQEVEDEEDFDLKSTINETIENITQINESLFGGSRQVKRQVNPYDINSVFAAVDELIADSKDAQKEVYKHRSTILAESEDDFTIRTNALKEYVARPVNLVDGINPCISSHEAKYCISFLYDPYVEEVKKNGALEYQIPDKLPVGHFYRGKGEITADNTCIKQKVSGFYPKKAGHAYSAAIIKDEAVRYYNAKRYEETEKKPALIEVAIPVTEGQYKLYEDYESKTCNDAGEYLGHYQDCIEDCNNVLSAIGLKEVRIDNLIDPSQLGISTLARASVYMRSLDNKIVWGISTEMVAFEYGVPQERIREISSVVNAFGKLKEFLILPYREFIEQAQDNKG